MRNSILGLIAISIAMMLSGCGSAKDDPIIPISTNTRTIQTQQVNEVRNAMTNVDASLVAYQRATSASDIQAQTNALTLMASSLEQLTTAVRVAQPYLDYSLYRAVADQMGRIDQAGMQNVQVMAQMAQVEIITAVGFLRTSRAQLQSTTDRLSVLDRSMAATNARLNVIESGTTTSVDKVRLLVLAEVARLTSSDTAIQNRITTVTNSLTTAIADNTRLIAQNSSNTAAQLLSINSSLTNIIDQNNAQGLINTSTTRAIEAMRAVIGEQISQEVAKLQANINANHSTLTARIDLLQQAVDVLQTTTVISIVSSLNAHVITQGVVNSSLSSSILSLQTSLTNYIASSILSLSNSLSATSSTVNARIDQLHSIVGALRNEDYQLAVLISSLTSRVTSNSTTTQSQISLIQAELLNLNAHRLSILAQVARLSSTDAAIQSRITTVTNTLITAIADNIRLIAQNSSSTAAQLLSINSSLTSIIAQNNAQGLINSSTTRAIEAMRMAISAQITQEVAKLQTNINANHSTLTARIDLLQQAIDVLQTTTVISIINSLNAHVITQGVVNSSLTASILSLQASLTNYITSSILSLSTSLTVTSSTINARINQLNWVIGGLVSEDARLALVIAGLTSSITSSLNNSSNQISILQAQVAQLTASVSALQALHRTPDVPIGTPTNVAGKAVDGLVIGGTVRVYTINESDCSPNILIGSTKTDSNGAFSVTLYGLTASQILLYEVSGGYYIEEWTQERVDLRTGDKLYAIGRIEPSSSVSNVGVTISGLTNLSYSLACHNKQFHRNNGLPPSMSQARDFAVPKINLLAGGLDVEGTVFKDVTSAEYAQTNTRFDGPDVNSFWYSFFTAGVSGLVANENKKQGASFHSIDFWKALAEDVRTDGVIDGTDANSKFIGIGIRRLHPDMIRTEVPRFATAFKTATIQNIKFAYQSDHDAFQNKVNIIHGSTSKIYGSAGTAVPLDNTPPVITLPRISGALSTNHIVATITDNSSITSVVYTLLDDSGIVVTPEASYNLLGHKGNLYKLNVDRNHPSGLYHLSVRARDGHLYGYSTTSFTIVRDAPRLTFSTANSGIISTGIISVSGSYTLPHERLADIQSITVNIGGGVRAVTAMIDTLTKTFKASTPYSVPSAKYILTIVVCDTVGNCHSYTKSQDVDKDPPQITVETLGSGSELKAWEINHLGFQEFNRAPNIVYAERTLAQLASSGIGYGSRILFKKGAQFLGNTGVNEIDLNRANIHFYAFNVRDAGIVGTKLDDLVIKLKYSTASYGSYTQKIGSSYQNIRYATSTLNVVKESTMGVSHYVTDPVSQAKRVVIPFTKEYWGKTLDESNIFATHIFEISVCDKAGLCSTKTLGLKFATASPLQSVMGGRITPLQSDLSLLRGDIVAKKHSLGGIKKFHKYTLQNTESMPVFVSVESANSNATLTRTYRQKTATGVNRWRANAFTVSASTCTDTNVKAGNSSATTTIILRELTAPWYVTSEKRPYDRVTNEMCTYKDYDGRVGVLVKTRKNWVWTNCEAGHGYYAIKSDVTVLSKNTSPTQNFPDSVCSYYTYVPGQVGCGTNAGCRSGQILVYPTRNKKNYITYTSGQLNFTTRVVTIPYISAKHSFYERLITTALSTKTETFVQSNVYHSVKVNGIDSGVSSTAKKWVKVPSGSTIEFFGTVAVSPPQWHSDSRVDSPSVRTEGIYKKDVGITFNYAPELTVEIKRADSKTSLEVPFVLESSEKVAVPKISLPMP